MKPELRAILERVEFVRHDLRLTKSAFAAAIGMIPQTYNNFTGAQGSKPNAELILGLVVAHGVNADWLLRGRGPVWRDGNGPADGMLQAASAFADDHPLQRLETLERDVAAIKAWFGTQWVEHVLPLYQQERENGGKETEPRERDPVAT